MMIRRNKYGAKRVTNEGGKSYASQLEAAVATILQSRINGGELAEIQQQDQVYLSEAEIRYIADFKCIPKDGSDPYYVEAKGFEGERWPTIKKLWRVYGPGKLEIWKGTHKRPVLDEVIIPRSPKAPRSQP